MRKRIVLLFSRNSKKFIISIVIFILVFGIIFKYSSRTKLTPEDFQCMRDEFRQNAENIEASRDNGDGTFRIAFFDQQNVSKWIAEPLFKGKEQLDKKSKYIMMVLVRPENSGRRRVFRDSIASPKYSRVIMNGAMRFVFVCGRSLDENVNLELKKEADTFGDILITEFLDSYVHLPYKVLSALLLATTRFEKAEIIAKYDEDVLFYPDHFSAYFENFRKDPILFSKPVIWGDFYDWNVVVNRNISSPYFVSKSSYKCDYYAEYISGPIYFMTKIAAQNILAITKHRNFQSVEDCLITGLYGMDIGAKLIKLPNMFFADYATKNTETTPLLTWHNKKNDVELKSAFFEMIETRCEPCRRFLLEQE